jgi:lipopolysaccharide/colanic/teichoic acid biosynthesis glycosyltransferase
MGYQAIKRVIDLLAAGLGLIILAPLIAGILLAIKLGSAGPAIFCQNRAGKNGKIFTLYKFRTMRTDTDPYGFSPKDESDPRVTKIGKILRKYSLDELPQLVNVLMGKMTLVGPRPLLPWQYDQWTDRQKRRCEVKPGLTGWAQVQGRGALTHEDKIELDLWYIDHLSPWVDLKILAQTAGQVLRGQDTLEVQYSKHDPEKNVKP